MKKQEKKTSVLLYTDWAGPLRCLPLDDAGRLFLAILDYTATGEAPAFDSPGAAMAWEFIKMQLDSNLEKWDAICQQRREAGAQGGRQRMKSQANQANATFAKQNQANQANAAFAKQSQANQADNEHELEHEYENEHENGAAAAAIEKAPDGAPPLPPPSSEKEQGNAPIPEAQWVALGLGEQAGPVIRQAIQGYREAGMEDGLIIQAMEEAAAHQVKAPAAYLKKILDRCQGEGIFTLAAWQARKRPAGGDKRVDRAAPSGNDFLADALTRPRRHKRK